MENKPESKLESKLEHFYSHWSSLKLTKEDTSYLRALLADNLEVFHGLQEQWPGGFFQIMGDEWEVGRMIAKGAQAMIFEANQTLPDGTKDKWMLKTFERWTSLRVLMASIPKGILTNLGLNGSYSNNHCCSLYGMMMLHDGRFAILMKRYWGDLRRLIDLRMGLKDNQSMPFPDMSIVIQIMLDIALGIQALHKDGIVHGDVKASNVLILPREDGYDPIHDAKIICYVADFETSIAVCGTGFWRAPEILDTIFKRDIASNFYTEKSDVYSFAMTSYEILTGHLPFDGHLRNTRGDRYKVVHHHVRPALPKDLDHWIKEFLEMCWHPDPLQRPSFEWIVDILEARLRKRRETNILAPRSSTWEERNDPRVWKDQDLSVEIPKKLPILIQMLAVVLQCCVEEVEKIKRCNDQVGMFKFQCAHLVTSLSFDAGKVFHRFQQVQQILNEPVVTNAHKERRELKYWLACVAFGIYSLVDLTRNFQTVLEMLSECGAEDWWKTALRYSTTPPHPQVPRWSVFSLALQQCQWSMDVVHLAIEKISKLDNAFGDGMFEDSRFQWCEERQRVVLHSTIEDLSNSLGVAAILEVEAQDRNELLRKLEMFLYEIRHEPHKNEFRLSSLLMTKLAGPIPQPCYLPYSFQIDPPKNLVRTNLATATWCGNIQCHLKEVKAQGYEVRKIMEVDAAPLAAVQHPNVVQLIGCLVQTSGHVNGLMEILTEVLTKLVHPSKGKRLHEATGMMVMELMEGDLRNLMDQWCPNPGPGSRPCPLIVALDIMLQIAQAMRFVHENKILHRDLKTTNILYYSTSTGALPSYPTLDLDRIRELNLLYLLTPERFYTVKLADFGSAKYSPNESSHSVNVNTGTPRYMAPEMFYNAKAEVPSKYNWSCDVYSFAMTCSAILTGNEPFHFFKNHTKTYAMASLVDKTALVQVRPDLGLEEALPSLKALIERCWDKDPLKRPPFSEICKELWDCKVQATISCLQRRYT